MERLYPPNTFLSTWPRTPMPMASWQATASPTGARFMLHPDTTIQGSLSMKKTFRNSSPPGTSSLMSTMPSFRCAIVAASRGASVPMLHGVTLLAWWTDGGNHEWNAYPHSSEAWVRGPFIEGAGNMLYSCKDGQCIRKASPWKVECGHSTWRGGDVTIGSRPVQTVYLPVMATVQGVSCFISHGQWHQSASSITCIIAWLIPRIIVLGWVTTRIMVLGFVVL